MSYFLRDGRAVKPEAVRDIVSVDRASARVWEPCHRCCGKGYIHGFEHIMAGVCFRCNAGKGEYRIKPCYSGAKLAKLEAAADKKAAKKADKIAAKRLDNLNRSIALVGDNLWVDIKDFALPLVSDEDLWDLSKNDRLIADLFHKAGAAVGGGLSEKAAALLVKCWENKIKWAAEKAEKEANAVDVPEGRYEVAGKVLNVREFHGDYGVNFKMLVDCGGYRVYGSVPASIKAEALAEDSILKLALVGRSVKFSAAFAPKEKGFGFFSRPSKAELVG